MGCRTILPAFSGEDQFRGADRFLDTFGMIEHITVSTSIVPTTRPSANSLPLDESGIEMWDPRQIGLWQLDTTLSDLQLITNFGLKNSPTLGNKATFQIGSPNLQYD